jgi:hypothetical protein
MLAGRDVLTTARPGRAGRRQLRHTAPALVHGQRSEAWLPTSREAARGSFPRCSGPLGGRVFAVRAAGRLPKT